MWRQILRILPKHLNHISYRTTLQKVAKKKKVLLHSTYLMSTAQVVIENLPETPCDKSNDVLETCVNAIDELQLAADIETTYAENSEALGDLISTLYTCIQDICDQYQECIAKQIEITMSNMSLDPVGEHWDEMTKYRVNADDLKVELSKYKTLVATIGSILKNEHIQFTKDSNLPQDDIKKINEAFKCLVDMIERRTKENSAWDSKLIDAHKKSILVTETTDE